MMKRIIGLSLAALIVAGASGRSSAQSLGLGDPAPRLDVKEFVKGEPVKGFEKGKNYVIEFWATWCGPCRTSIPHVSELQKKYPDVTFIGVSVWEEDQKEVVPFVKEMGDKMSYRVAIDSVPENGDGNEGKMANGWMKAAGEGGIPSSFIVNGEGKVAWIGHPMAMDKPLDQIVTGTYDLAAAIKERKESGNAEAALAKLQEKLGKAMRDGDTEGALKALDDAFGETPGLEKMLGSFKFMLLIKEGDEEQALAYGEKLHADVKDNADALNNLAWTIVDPDNEKKAPAGLVKLALKAATRADELDGGKNPAVADTLAKALFDSGEPSKAYEAQKRALKLAEGTELADDEGMKERLEQYKKAAEKTKA